MEGQREPPGFRRLPALAPVLGEELACAGCWLSCQAQSAAPEPVAPAAAGRKGLRGVDRRPPGLPLLPLRLHAVLSAMRPGQLAELPACEHQASHLYEGKLDINFRS